MKLPPPLARFRAVLTPVVRRAAASAWPLVQGTAAAAVAWLFATHVLLHEDAFFAPLAAFVALNTSVGDRGLNAARLVFGVILGIVVGEITVVALGGGLGSMAVAILVATAIAQAMGGARIVIAQAAAGAILTVATADAHAGLARLSDALVGAGVALIFSQVLFAPEPVALLRRAEDEVLQRIMNGLDLMADALELDSTAFALRAIDQMRLSQDDTTRLRWAKDASERVSRRTRWRSRRTAVLREIEHAERLDLISSASLIAAGLVGTLTPQERILLAPNVRALATATERLAGEERGKETRKRVVEETLVVAAAMAKADSASDRSTLPLVTGAIYLVSVDLMVFVGVPTEEVAEAVRTGRAPNL